MTAPYPTTDPDSIGWLTEEQMIEVDRVMIEDLDIGLIQMMENAGRNLARLILDLYRPERVSIAAGSGGNGGGGLVAARHLANAGAEVTMTTTRPANEIEGVPRRQLDILERMGVAYVAEPFEADVIVDALIGYSLRGAPRGRTADLIEAVNEADAAVVALDTPSGLDVTSGTTPGAVVEADQTMTLCLPKRGLREAAVVGDLYLADISVPRSVTAQLGPSSPDFAPSSILHLPRSANLLGAQSATNA